MPNTATYTVQVNRSGSGTGPTAVATSGSPSIYGNSVTFTATVSPNAGSNGTVAFKDGVTTIAACSAVSLSSSQAVCASSALSATGSPHTITAVYSGGGTFAGSTSSSLSQTVSKAALSITANADSKTYGQTKTYGSGSTAFTPIGLQNSETIASVTISASGGTANNAAVGSYTLTPSAPTGGTFTAGNYSITYNTGTLTVNPAATATVLVSSANPSANGQSVTFTATVTSSGGTIPNGETVTFKDGATTLGTGTTANGTGVATYATSALSIGGSPHSITAVYAGDTNFVTSTSSPALSQVINKADTTTTLATSGASTYGTSVTFTATVTAGATGNVSFYQSGTCALPAP
jgi:Bacterial Ig-like domain (group 3)/MBG domain (YGX type)